MIFVVVKAADGEDGADEGQGVVSPVEEVGRVAQVDVQGYSVRQGAGGWRKQFSICSIDCFFFMRERKRRV